MEKDNLIYLDTNIFITFFMKRNGYKKLESFFQENDDLEVKFVTSDWTLTEIVKVLTIEYHVISRRVAEFIQKLQREKRVFGTKFLFIEVSKKEGYDLGEFFFQLQKLILQYKGGIADSIHTLIMENNNVNTILTTDSHFEGMKGIISINPLKSN